MSQIVSDSKTDNNQGCRCAGSFKDGPYIRRVEARPGNVLVVCDTEGHELYRETALQALGPYAIRTIDAETSTFSGTLVLIIGGFTPDTSDSRVVTISTDYRIQPPAWFTGTKGVL